jgi:methionyl-tRNA formyltransferase
MEVPSSTTKIVFFGSFQDYSALILQGLLQSDVVSVVAIVTTPPFTAPKTGEVLKNPVHELADVHALPVFTPDTLDENSLAEVLAPSTGCDFFVTAGYGKLLPTSWLQAPPRGALNLHFSLLPKYRGANPAEWALLLNEKETGVTLIEMSPEFDTGYIIAQASLDITTNETRETLYHRLYTLGAQVLPPMLSAYAGYQHQQEQAESAADITYFLPPRPQPPSPTPYAKRFKREDAFISWPTLWSAMTGVSQTPAEYGQLLNQAAQVAHSASPTIFIERAVRALAGFPAVWTLIPTVKGQKRMKVLQVHLSPEKRLVLDTVQIEGQQPASWNQIKNQVTQT